MDAGGVMPANVPATWHVYFAVENAYAANTAIVAALAHGGALVQPADDPPFGRNAVLTGPTGAAVNITQELPSAR